MKKIALVLLMVSMAASVFAAADRETAEAVVEGGLESPMLHEMVMAGDLPPLEERLPVPGDAMVEPDIISLGEHGGHLSITTNDRAHWTWGPWTEQSMFRFTQDGSGGVEANVAKDYYANEDSTVWTIELREGMKWSDGVPFTADDVIFYYDHMSTPALNPDRTPVGVDEPGYYNAFTSKPYRAYQVIVDGEVHWADFEKINDYKFTVTFAAPKPDFPEIVAIDNKWMFAAKHFFKDLVARKDGVSDDPTFPLITEEEALANANRIIEKEWTSYSQMGKGTGYYNWDYYQIPQVRSFIATANNWDKAGEIFELVRNPYFFKVDTEGRQLPYLDSIRISIINENEQVILKAASGEFDYLSVGDADFATVATATQATHSVVSYNSSAWGDDNTLQLNQTVADPDKRALFQDARFREALSLSVDRNLLNATLYNGQSEPNQASVPEGLPGYDSEWARKWTEFDVERANALLDEITGPWDRSQGTYRKMRGTNRDLEIIVLLAEPSMEGSLFSLLRSAFGRVGVKLSDKLEADIARAILANEHEATLKWMNCITPALRPDNVVPMRNFMPWYGAYGKWYEDNRSEANGGVTPTGDVLELVNAYDAIRSASGEDRDEVIAENVQRIYDLHEENTWVISFLRPMPKRHIVSNDLKNFAPGLIWSDEFRYVNIFRPEQLYMAK